MFLKRFAGVVLGVVLLLSTVDPLVAEEVLVSDAGELKDAISRAQPGDRIVLRPGTYRLGKTRINRGGTEGAPITLTTKAPDRTKVETTAVELFKVSAPHWIFENLDIRGGAQSDHAFHIVGRADHIKIRGSRLVNFHAAIKGNGEGGEFPDFVVIEDNALYNEAPRDTAAPVTPVDVVGGEGWVLRSNFIADFAKLRGNRITYAAFLKGGSSNGIFEKNLVYCEWRHAGGRRVGLSFGGGGYFFDCANGECPAEHSNGVMRNNIVLNCPHAVGIYIRNSERSKLYHNTLYRAYGVMLRFAGSGAHIQNNIISGSVVLREGARASAADNLETGFPLGSYIVGAAEKLKYRISDYHKKFPSVFDRSDIVGLQALIGDTASWLGESALGRGDADFARWFVSPATGDLSLFDGAEILARGPSLPEVEDDFCGNRREPGSVDLGAIEYRSGGCDLEAWLRSRLGKF